MLTPKQCKKLLKVLKQPEKNIIERIKNLSPQEKEPTRVKRASARIPAKNNTCIKDLKNWVQDNGKQMYFDRLTRALRSINRGDIAREVGKNINQDKVLKLQRYVEGYHKFVSSLNLPKVQGEKKKPQGKQKGSSRKVRDLTWRDLDLIVVRSPVPPYQKGPLDVVLPLLYGLLVGFFTTLVAVVSVFIYCRRKPQCCMPEDNAANRVCVMVDTL
ncbi:transmembrane and death domain protein 1 [Genypterus blacodes]|uniref:transmembrane and death domain protein 1 n=1 Tax=Genypterus blacodes TaxID=154954 RepID=UPI003F773D62